MARAVIALGANLGDTIETLEQVIGALCRLPGTKVLACSNLYETDPVGYEEQPNFVNCALLLETGLSARALLGAALGVEAVLGRVRSMRNGPRVVDVDLLLYEGVTSGDPELMLPHPRMLARAFVLVPLSDLFPSGDALGLPFDEERRKLGEKGVRFAREPLPVA